VAVRSLQILSVPDLGDWSTRRRSPATLIVEMSNGEPRISYTKPGQPTAPQQPDPYAGQPGYNQYAPPQPQQDQYDTQRRQADGALGRQEAASYGSLLGQTMLLVGLALLVMTVGAYIGRDYGQGTALLFSLSGFGMLIAQSFVAPLRHGLLGTSWLFGAALAIGLGLGPVLAYYVSVNPDLVMESMAMTAVIVLGAATFGTFTARDLARWMRPLSLVVFGAVLVSWGMLAFGGGGSPIISIIIGVVSAALIVVDFNYLRRRATEDDVIWLATGIFVSIVNIFLSLLNLGD
jgi:modulator of FtsH protease